MAKLDMRLRRPGAKLDRSALKSMLNRTRRTILGAEADKGLLFKLFIYVILIDTAYIYLNPIIYMVVTMVKDASDLLDPAVTWIPRAVYLGHLQDAWGLLDFNRSFLISTAVSLGIAAMQTISCAVAGYAFARLKFPFKNFWFLCLILTFIVPAQATILPSLIAGSQIFGWQGTYIPLLLPALFGHGLKGALYVIIFRQFFSTQPKELEEAAKIDGANVFKVFYRVMLPLAQPAIIVVFLFSFVWNWNDAYFPAMYLIGVDHVPLSLKISRMADVLLQREKQGGLTIFTEPVKMAASFLMIAAPSLLYAFTQRWFVEGVERTGLVE